jgi:hypothetical protein
VSRSELSSAEQAHVRAALAFLRARCGGWRPLTKAIGFTRKTLTKPASPAVVFRVARLAGVGVDDILTGKYPPPGACAHCGHVSEAAV